MVNFGVDNDSKIAILGANGQVSVRRWNGRKVWFHVCLLNAFACFVVNSIIRVKLLY
jgi:hypothetical protein